MLAIILSTVLPKLHKNSPSNPSGDWWETQSTQARAYLCVDVCVYPGLLGGECGCVHRTGISREAAPYNALLDTSQQECSWIVDHRELGNH